MKEKDLVFLPTRKKEKRKADPHCTHLQITQANLQTKICKRVQFLPTLKERHQELIKRFSDNQQTIYFCEQK